ncbi:MAG: hypothetical protein ACI9JN_001869 [Bacteroidia bacterium]|jgi:hypothetical protein
MRFIISLLLLSSCLVSNGQDYRVAYSQYDLFHPGITIAKPFVWTNKTKEKDKKKGLKRIGKSNLFLPQFTYYNQIRTENNFSIGCELVRQRHRMKPANWKFETGVGLHYVRSFNAGKTFELQDGTFKRIRFAGQNYFAPSLSYSVGRDFFKKRPRPISTYIKPQVLLLMPYNAGVVPSIYLQLGVSLPLKALNHE